MAVSFIPTSSTLLLHRPPPRIRSENHAPFSRIKASWQEVAGVMVFSAIPFTAVKAIANSPLGEALQRQMEQKKKLYAENSSKFKALEEKAREEREIVEFVVPNTLVFFSTLNLKGLAFFFTNLSGVKPFPFKRDESGSLMHIGFAFMLEAIGNKEGNVESPTKLSSSILQNFGSLEGDGCFCNHYGERNTEFPKFTVNNAMGNWF